MKNSNQILTTTRIRVLSRTTACGCFYRLFTLDYLKCSILCVKLHYMCSQSFSHELNYLFVYIYILLFCFVHWYELYICIYLQILLMLTQCSLYMKHASLVSWNYCNWNISKFIVYIINKKCVKNVATIKSQKFLFNCNNLIKYAIWFIICRNS